MAYWRRILSGCWNFYSVFLIKHPPKLIWFKGDEGGGVSSSHFASLLDEIYLVDEYPVRAITICTYI